ncbi:hypothetical protein NA57DRAFT_76492 [Rhizodiscina lignyota]|uniref:Sialidase n=1 Tax=Rhizodiscina lignyota TaxID=1504668 RepID=A0A9P4IGC5_9PEZI|nr:hypothetical protein NA57DRAFT_76492 [Rhizodiscina lignyota]
MYSFTHGAGSWYDSDASHHTSDSSPESLFTTSTARTTPPRESPVRQYGAVLLPKVRQQDQVTEPVAGAGPIRHRRNVSSASSYQNSVYHPYLQRPTLNCRGISPSKDSELQSPASHLSLAVSTSGQSPAHSGLGTTLTSPIEFPQPQQPQSRRSSLAPVRASSAGPTRGHSRSGSGSSLDELNLGRYGYPTYRQTPSYITSAAYPSTTVTAVPDPGIFNVMPSLSDSFQFPQQMSFPSIADFTFEPPAQPVSSLGSSSILNYLTTPNPSPALVRRITSSQRTITPHFWFDIRNLRSWNSFSMSAISSIPDLLHLIQLPVDNAFLPQPARPTSTQPESEGHLHEIYSDFFCAKINAALQMSQGNHHMLMRANKPNGTSRTQPDFISNYPTDMERTFQGELRGRVVGLVKAYDDWNTGMRSEGPQKKVDYLRGLAHLHRVMREHGCRYGFIITEIELLCVRAGGMGSGEAASTAGFDANTPIFGYLETSAPIQLSTHVQSTEDGSMPPLTAGLALWYLHMLAKDEPLPGHEGGLTWRMDVGGPVLRTRANCIDKDDWVPKPSLLEKREAKRHRGWIWPEDPFHRKELGGKKRGRAA